MYSLFIKGILAVAASTLVYASAPPTTIAPTIERVVQNTATSTVSLHTPDALDRWLDSLEQKELSSADPNRERCILDVNNKISCGCLQFQEETFEREATRLYNRLNLSAEPSEVMNLYKDCPTQKALARAMILDDHSAWRNWFTSVTERGLGLPPHVPAD